MKSLWLRNSGKNGSHRNNDTKLASPYARRPGRLIYLSYISAYFRLAQNLFSRSRPVFSNHLNHIAGARFENLFFVLKTHDMFSISLGEQSAKGFG